MGVKIEVGTSTFKCEKPTALWFFRCVLSASEGGMSEGQWENASDIWFKSNKFSSTRTTRYWDRRSLDWRQGEMSRNEQVLKIDAQSSLWISYGLPISDIRIWSPITDFQISGFPISRFPICWSTLWVRRILGCTIHGKENWRTTKDNRKIFRALPIRASSTRTKRYKDRRSLNRL